MKGRIVKYLCSVIFLVSIMLVSGARAQAPPDQGHVQDQGQQIPEQGPIPGQAQVPAQEQAPVKEEKPKQKEFQKVFCAESSVPQRYGIINGVIRCADVCDRVYQEYPCDLQRWLDEGWKVTSVSVSEIVAERDPCECRITGTESVLEKD